MTETKVSSRYASSFLSSSIEKNNLEKATADMRIILHAIESSRDLQLAMKSPVIKSDVKESILTEIFSRRIDAESINFVKFIIRKGRESLIDSIARRFLEMRDEHLGILQAQVHSAFELSSEHKEQIKKSFEYLLNKRVNISYQIDEKLLGGFVAKIGDTIYDASVKHQLGLLKKHFVKSGISLN
jgi:F-type H+-transporting ATPase subunit delta